MPPYEVSDYPKNQEKRAYSKTTNPVFVSTKNYLVGEMWALISESLSQVYRHVKPGRIYSRTKTSVQTQLLRIAESTFSVQYIPGSQPSIELKYSALKRNTSGVKATSHAAQTTRAICFTPKSDFSRVVLRNKCSNLQRLAVAGNLIALC